MDSAGMSNEPVEAFPLSWPVGRPRTGQWNRSRSAFKTSFAKARDNIISEVRLLGGTAMVISSNIALRRDGLPYANFSQPDDTGVAVYFTRKKRQMCFACDRYLKAEDNIHAISLTIGALRGIARWGTGDMMEAAFTGFTALPAPGQTTAQGWREVFGFGSLPATMADVESVYKALRSKHHPDKGGTAEAFNSVQTAYEQAKQELGG